MTDAVATALRLIDEGEPAEARAHLEAAVGAGGDDAEIHAAHGTACLLTKDYPAAEASASRALERDATNLEALEVRARARLSLLDVPGAEADADAVLRRDPDSVNALVCKGSARLVDGATADARAHFEKAYRVEPRSGEAALGVSSAFAQEGDLPRAREWAERAAESEPLDSAPWAALGALSAQDGDFQAGLECVDLALALSVPPDLDALHSLRGVCLMGLGRADEAEAELREAESRNPLDPIALTLLASLESARGDDSPELRERAGLASAILGPRSRAGREMEAIARGRRKPSS